LRASSSPSRPGRSPVIPRPEHFTTKAPRHHRAFPSEELQNCKQVSKFPSSPRDLTGIRFPLACDYLCALSRPWRDWWLNCNIRLAISRTCPVVVTPRGLTGHPGTSLPLPHFTSASDFPVEAIAAFEWIPGITRSDHWSFWKEGYPALMLTDTAPFRYPEYQGSRDLPEQINAREFARAAHGIIQAVRRLAGGR